MIEIKFENGKPYLNEFFSIESYNQKMKEDNERQLEAYMGLYKRVGESVLNNFAKNPGGWVYISNVNCWNRKFRRFLKRLLKPYDFTILSTDEGRCVKLCKKTKFFFIMKFVYFFTE